MRVVAEPHIGLVGPALGEAALEAAGDADIALLDEVPALLGGEDFERVGHGGLSGHLIADIRDFAVERIAPVSRWRLHFSVRLRG